MSRGLTLVTSNTVQNDIDHLAGGGSGLDVADAQSLVGGNGRLARALFYATKIGAPTGNIVSSLYAITGTPGTNAVPTGSPLVTSDNVSITTVTFSFDWVQFDFSGANQYRMTPGTNYCLSIEFGGGDASNYLVPGYDHTASGTTNVSIKNSGGTWIGTFPGTLTYYVYML